MAHLTTKKAMAVAIAFSLSACSSSDGIAPEAADRVSSGVITGFGSIFVNGVEFETDSATINIDGVSGTQDDLAIGMKVDVDGNINADGVTGTASHVDFDEELQGPVTGINAGDGQTRSFSVLGTTVIIDAIGTRFDDEAGSFNFDSIEDNDNVEISGFFDETGSLQATRVELEDEDFNADSIVEVEGVISGLSGTDFMLGNLIVDASSAQLEDLANGLVDGIKVEVKGSYDVASNTLIATNVEAEDDDLEDSENEIEIEGFVTDYVSDASFKVDGHMVNASGAEREPASLVFENGLHVEVEGNVVDGVLVASEVKTRAAEVEVAALVTGVNVESSTLTLRPVPGQPEVTVKITTTTELEDDVSDLEPFNISHIQIDHFLKVEGHINDAGELEAKSVERKDAADEEVSIEAIITAFDNVSVTTTVTVLGIDFPYVDATTEFEKEGVAGYTSTDFFNETSVINSTAVISVEDENADGIADKIELED